MMKVLMANNHGYIRGGAEKVFFDEVELLKSNNIDVLDLSYNDDNVEKYAEIKQHYLSEENNIFKLLKNVYWNTDAYNHVKNIITENKIDIFHAHNTYTRLSPSILFAAKEAGAKVFVTLHDLKYICPHYSMLHDYKICQDCKGGKFYNAVKNKCHKNSYIKSAIVSSELYYYRKLEIDKVVDAFISPSKFLVNIHKEMGFSGNLVYLPNFIENNSFDETSLVASNDEFLFVGRLSYEKGIKVLLESFLNNDLKLTLIGDGPMKNMAMDFIESNKLEHRIKLLGHLSTEDVMSNVAKCKALILSSQTYENAPISILEALSLGKPVIASEIGGIPEMVHNGKNGFLFKPGCSVSLNSALQSFEKLTSDEVTSFSDYSHFLVQSDFSSKRHLDGLLNIYNGNF